MQTQIRPELLATDAGREADRILRSCVHCGFCTATCPTYQLLGDELDGPRGRIYQIKALLEGEPVTKRTLEHLDRCLTCRGCESTCPSGVEYAHLVEIGRELAESKIGRPLLQRILRKSVASLLTHRRRFTFWIRGAALVRPLLPQRLKTALPKINKAQLHWPEQKHARRVLLIEGCVQPVLAADIDCAAALVLDRLGISTVRTAVAQCCGAVEHHLSQSEAALQRMRNNIDHWWPFIAPDEGVGVEAVISTASACALELKEYGYLLRHDAGYAEKAACISALARDISEVVAAEDVSQLKVKRRRRITFHPSCTLQHGQKLNGVVEKILQQAGFELLPVQDAHLCCGAAGTYALMQPEIGLALRDKKVASLQNSAPAVIATANIGCLKHLDAAADTDVRHWIELLNEQG